MNKKIIIILSCILVVGIGIYVYSNIFSKNHNPELFGSWEFIETLESNGEDDFQNNIRWYTLTFHKDGTGFFLRQDYSVYDNHGLWGNEYTWTSSEEKITIKSKKGRLIQEGEYSISNNILTFKPYGLEFPMKFTKSNKTH